MIYNFIAGDALISIASIAYLFKDYAVYRNKIPVAAVFAIDKTDTRNYHYCQLVDQAYVIM
jgi:hypothetical protein